MGKAIHYADYAYQTVPSDFAIALMPLWHPEKMDAAIDDPVDFLYNTVLPMVEESYRPKGYKLVPDEDVGEEYMDLDRFLERVQPLEEELEEAQADYMEDYFSKLHDLPEGSRISQSQMTEISRWLSKKHNDIHAIIQEIYQEELEDSLPLPFGEDLGYQSQDDFF